MDTITKITSSTIGLLAIIAIVMSSGLIGQEDVYACENLNLAMQCDSLSGVNSDGLQTRCYFFSEELSRDTYKSCSSGWLKYEFEIIEQEIPETTGKKYLCDQIKCMEIE